MTSYQEQLREKLWTSEASDKLQIHLG